MAFPAISNLGENPFFNTAESQGSVAGDLFGMFLASSGSELYLGGSDSAHFTGSIEYHTVDTSSGFWQITGAKAIVGSKTTNTGFETIIDSGTTIMFVPFSDKHPTGNKADMKLDRYGPPSAVKTFYASVSGSAVYDSTNGYYSFPCSSVPEVSFSWGGTKWQISAAKFVAFRCMRCTI